MGTRSYQFFVPIPTTYKVLVHLAMGLCGSKDNHYKDKFQRHLERHYGSKDKSPDHPPKSHSGSKDGTSASPSAGKPYEKMSDFISHIRREKAVRDAERPSNNLKKLYDKHLDAVKAEKGTCIDWDGPYPSRNGRGAVPSAKKPKPAFRAKVSNFGGDHSELDAKALLDELDGLTGEKEEKEKETVTAQTGQDSFGQGDRRLAGVPDRCAGHDTSSGTYAALFILVAFLIMALLYVFRARFTSKPRKESYRSSTDRTNFEYEADPYFDLA